jgi:hypothetical protein
LACSPPYSILYLYIRSSPFVLLGTSSTSTVEHCWLSFVAFTTQTLLELTRYEYGYRPTSTTIAGCLGLGIDGNEVVHIVCIHDAADCGETVHVGDADDTDTIPVVGPVKTAQDDAR